MKKIYLPTLLLLLSIYTTAQTEIKAVKADENIDQVFTTKDLYRYPMFQMGQVHFRDDSIADVKLNYHKFFNQIKANAKTRLENSNFPICLVKLFKQLIPYFLWYTRAIILYFYCQGALFIISPIDR